MIQRRFPESGPGDEIQIRLRSATVGGSLTLPRGARGAVLFAHGSGSSRLSPRNRFVADRLAERGLGTLLADLLTPEEDADPERRFDIPFLVERLKNLTRWFSEAQEREHLRIGFFGASTGAAAALRAAADLGPRIQAVVSRGGRPDLATDALGQVRAPTLLIVGGDDPLVLEWNREALRTLAGPKSLVVVPGATHLFEEPGALERVADEAASWFERYLTG